MKEGEWKRNWADAPITMLYVNTAVANSPCGSFRRVGWLQQGRTLPGYRTVLAVPAWAGFRFDRRRGLSRRWEPAGID